MKIKKLLAFVLAMAMTFSLAACGKKDLAPKTSSSKAEGGQPVVLDIIISQYGNKTVEW